MNKTTRKTVQHLLLCLFITMIIPPSTYIIASSKTANQIIDKYVKAVGGPALNKIETEIREGTLLRGRVGKVPFDIVTRSPGKWRWQQTFAWGDRMCYGFDGSQAWIQDINGVTEMSSEQFLDLRLILDPGAPLKLRDWFPHLSVKKLLTDDADTTVVLSASTSDGLTAQLEFHRESGLLIRAGDIRFEDYRDVGGIKRPYRIILGRDEGEAHLKMAMEFTETTHNAEIDEYQFQPPVSGLPSVASPLYKRRKRAYPAVEALDTCTGRYQHPDNPNVVYTVTRQENHLMLIGTGWPQKYEIMAESDTDYYFQFLGWEFHFIKDASGTVTALQLDGATSILAQKINP